jgi:tetratricopeptide (TPR) repeat protein
MNEKNLIEVTPECRGLFQNGCAASAQGDWDKAIALFNQALIQEPSLVECRGALRKAQLARFQKNGFVKHAFDELREALELAKAELYVDSKPLKAIGAAEHVLNRVPTSVLAHKIFAAAALKKGMFRTAFLSLDFIRTHGGRDDLDVNLELANALAESGQVSKGLAICGRMLKEFPKNPGVTRTLERLSKLAFDEHDTPWRSARVASRLQKSPGKRYGAFVHPGKI